MIRERAAIVAKRFLIPPRRRIVSAVRPLVVFALLPAMALVRLLRPLVLIRFGRIWTDRIGHFIGNTEKYLCERDAGRQPAKAVDLFYFDGKVTANGYLKRMWKRRLHVFSVVRFLSWANDAWPDGDVHRVEMPSDQGFHEYHRRIRPHLEFTESEQRRGEAYLAGKGLGPASAFVCFFSRDARYLDAVHHWRSREEWAYHDYRNASIETHLPAIEYLCNRLGYAAFRMGSIVKDPLGTGHPRIVDYACNGDRTEFLDIFLCARCRFFLQSGGSGIVSVARVFQRPIVPVNQIPLHWCHSNPSVVFIPKMLWSVEKKRLLSFPEIIHSRLDGISNPGVFQRAGIETIDNTAAEILAVTKEAELRLAGQWPSDEDDEHLQRRFQALFPEEQYDPRYRSRIGAEFLRTHQELLEAPNR